MAVWGRGRAEGNVLQPVFAPPLPRLQGYVQPMRAELPRPCWAARSSGGPSAGRRTDRSQGHTPPRPRAAWQGATFSPKGARAGAFALHTQRIPGGIQGSTASILSGVPKCTPNCVPGTQGSLKERSGLHSRRLWTLAGSQPLTQLCHLTATRPHLCSEVMVGPSVFRQGH